MQNTVDLLAAVRSSDRAAVDVLLHVNVSQSGLNTALCWSARLGQYDITQKLITVGADPNCRIWGGFSPLLWATIFAENTDVIHLLLDAGSDVNCASHQRHQTVLHAAVIRGHPELTKILLSRGANPDNKDYISRTPLHYAVQKNHLECLKLLISFNCNVNISGWLNDEYVSPLYLSLLQNNLKAAEMLLLAGAKFNRPTIYCSLTLNQFYSTMEKTLNMQVRPVYLQQQCRICIRHQFSYDIMQKLEKLVFPKCLKDFLLLKELNVCLYNFS